MVRHPVIASWRVTVEVAGGDGIVLLIRPSMDGGVAAVLPSPAPAGQDADTPTVFWSMALGEWEATGETTARLLAIALGVDGTGLPVGTRTLTASATVDPAGLGWGGPLRIETADAGGDPAGEVRGTASAVRMTIP